MGSDGRCWETFFLLKKYSAGKYGYGKFQTVCLRSLQGGPRLSSEICKKTLFNTKVTQNMGVICLSQ